MSKPVHLDDFVGRHVGASPSSDPMYLPLRWRAAGSPTTREAILAAGFGEGEATRILQGIERSNPKRRKRKHKRRGRNRR